MSPRPQLRAPRVAAARVTSAQAWAPVRGRRASALMARTMGGLDASAWPVTRIRHICMANLRNAQTPSSADQKDATSVMAQCEPLGWRPRVRARMKVSVVRRTARTKGSGAEARKARAIWSPIRESMGRDYGALGGKRYMSGCVQRRQGAAYDRPVMFGSHLSIAGGLVRALDEAERLGFETVQIFTKNQRQWAFKPLEDEPREAWLAGLDRLGWRDRTVAHDSYLINLASPKDDLWAKSIDLMKEELWRCDQLSIPFLVSHPGAHTGSGEDAGLDRIAEAYRTIFRDRPDFKVTLCLENTAGGGSTLGRSFEELADLRGRIIDRAGSEFADRVGFCVDTCHALAAGYDITTEKKAERVIGELGSVCGFANVKVAHLNDSKGALGSHVDRHEHIGMGEVGKGAFWALVNCPDLAGVPMILETPKGETDQGTPWDSVNLRLLRGMIRDQSSGKKRVSASVCR